MQYLNRVRLIALSVTALCATPGVYALGTDADQDVTNSVTMSYEVNSIAQSTTTSVTFEVDRKYVVAVGTGDTDWVTAIPGQTFASGNYSSLQFSVTNNSNDAVGIRLALIDQADTDVTGFTDPATAELVSDLVTVWEDSNGNGVFDAGDQNLGNSLGVLPVLSTPVFAEDETRDYYVSIDVPAGAASELFETYTLVAAITESTGTSVVQTDDSGNSTVGVADPAINPNTMGGVEEVFAEFASGNPEDLGFDFVTPAVVATADDDFDGQASNSSGFRTRVALGVAKYVEVLWDPVTGNKYDAAGALTGNDPKAIPGAVLMYVIGVSADSGVDATLVTLDDDIPETLILPGDPNSVVGVELPTSVDITIGGSVTTFTLDPAIALDDQQHVVDCATSTLTSSAFDAGPEIDDASLGSCDAGETGYVLYFVTVNDT
ncbi:MAG: hypothetical protein RJQ07_11080 [Pseudomonadales bacterium]